MKFFSAGKITINIDQICYVADQSIDEGTGDKMTVNVHFPGGTKTALVGEEAKRLLDFLHSTSGDGFIGK